MQDVMVDLETKGQHAGCAIISIGAIGFDPLNMKFGEEFYQVIRASSCKKFGLFEDPNTMDWWKKQSPEARVALDQTKGTKTNMPLDLALGKFNGWLLQNFGTGVRIWGNGSDFDNAIMASAYRACGGEQAWKFWNNRCFRTLKNLHPDVKVGRSGTHHNALDDARTQAEHALAIFAKMNR